jgi:hypothetical protein
METATYIGLLLKKYRQAPSFPFDDRATDPVSFYALMNLWDEIFRIAAGQTQAFYFGNDTVRMEPSSVIFDVSTRDKTRRVDVYPQPTGGDFFVAAKLATDGYAPDLLHLGHLPDRSELAFQCDLDPARLAAAFDMIRTYTHASIVTADDVDAMDAAFSSAYGKLFGRTENDADEAPDDDAP